MSKRILVSVALLALLSVGTTIDVRAEMAASDVEEALTCQCGCGLTVHSCNHLECSFAVPTRKDIAESLARGETGEQIIDRYKLKYGEKVLSSPLSRSDLATRKVFFLPNFAKQEPLHHQRYCLFPNRRAGNLESSHRKEWVGALRK